MYVLSRYSYEVTAPEKSDHGSADEALLYNSFADSLARLPRPLLQTLMKGSSDGLESYPRELRMLKDEGFLVGDAFDETEELRQWYKQFTQATDTLAITLLLSYRCNFACPYCFEAKYMSGVRIERATQDHVVQWAETLMDQKEIPHLHVTFFGGEPLIERSALFHLIAEFRRICEARGLQFDFSLVTNGYHLTKAMYEELKALGLVHVKVTLDGDKETHDEGRPLRGGQGTFDRIFENLKDIGVLTSFTIGGNYDQDDERSTGSVLKLLNRLAEAGLDQTVGQYGFKPLMQAGTEATESFVSNLGDGDLRGFIEIEREMRKRKLRTIRRVVSGPCEALLEHSVAIDPRGDIYPCGAFAGDQRASIGNVATGYNSNYDHIMGFDAMEHPACATCKNLPGCFGGCRWAALKSKGDYRAFQCAGDFYHKAVPSLLTMEAREADNHS